MSLQSLKSEIKNPFKAGQNAYLAGKSADYDPYRNMGSDFHSHQNLWHEGYESAKNKK